MFNKPENKELNEKTNKQLERLEALTEVIESDSEKNAQFESQLIEYMIENKISELTVGDVVVELNIDEAIDIEKLKEDGVYDKYTKIDE